MNECYIVMEEDRGLGPTAIVVTLDENEAKALAAKSSHYWVERSEINLFPYMEST